LDSLKADPTKKPSRSVGKADKTTILFYVYIGKMEVVG